jgi:ABC-type nitrate/sulfonate/bicarbonate transport system permease component
VVIACVVGNVLGVLASQYGMLERLTFAIADATRNVSAIALLPAFIVTLGIGIAPKIVVIFWTAYPAALITALHAMRGVPHELTEAASLDGASPWQVMRFIKLPLATAGIVSGWRIAVSGGWISLVAAEMLGANRGLGYAVLISSQTFRFERMYAAIIVIALLGYAMSKVLEHLANHLERKP